MRLLRLTPIRSLQCSKVKPVHRARAHANRTVQLAQCSLQASLERMQQLAWLAQTKLNAHMNDTERSACIGKSSSIGTEFPMKKLQAADHWHALGSMCNCDQSAALVAGRVTTSLLYFGDCEAEGTSDVMPCAGAAGVQPTTWWVFCDAIKVTHRCVHSETKQIFARRWLFAKHAEAQPLASQSTFLLCPFTHVSRLRCGVLQRISACACRGVSHLAHLSCMRAHITFRLLHGIALL